MYCTSPTLSTILIEGEPYEATAFHDGKIQLISMHSATDNCCGKKQKQHDDAVPDVENNDKHSITISVIVCHTKLPQMEC